MRGLSEATLAIFAKFEAAEERALGSDKRQRNVVGREDQTSGSARKHEGVRVPTRKGDGRKGSKVRANVDDQAESRSKSAKGKSKGKAKLVAHDATKKALHESRSEDRHTLADEPSAFDDAHKRRSSKRKFGDVDEETSRTRERELHMLREDEMRELRYRETDVHRVADCNSDGDEGEYGEYGDDECGAGGFSTGE